MATFFLLLGLTATAFGQSGSEEQMLEACSRYCANATRQLEECSLPPLDEEYFLRNLTIWDDGTDMRRLETREDADCLCIEARQGGQESYWNWCFSCMFNERVIEQDPPLMEYSDAEENLDEYRSDCKRLGYLEGDSLMYPSATGESMPSATPTGGACASECGVLRGQIGDCGLEVTLEDRRYIDRERLSETFSATVLKNRTAAECLCTVPVLERMPQCLYCLREEEDDQQAARMASHYATDCEAFGYRVKTEPVQSNTGDEDASSTSTADGSTETLPPGFGGGEGGGNAAGRLVVDIISVATAVSLMLVVMS